MSEPTVGSAQRAILSVLTMILDVFIQAPPGIPPVHPFLPLFQKNFQLGDVLLVLSPI